MGPALSRHFWGRQLLQKGHGGLILLLLDPAASRSPAASERRRAVGPDGRLSGVDAASLLRNSGFLDRLVAGRRGVGPQPCEDAVEVTRSIGQAEGEGRAVPSEPVGRDRFSARELRGHVGEGVRQGMRVVEGRLRPQDGGELASHLSVALG